MSGSLYAVLLDVFGARVEEGRRFALSGSSFLPVLVYAGRVYMKNGVAHGSMGVYQEASTHFVQDTPAGGIKQF